MSSLQLAYRLTSHPNGSLESFLDAFDEVDDQDSDATSISTTATADDLPGAGRTVGLAFSYLGQKLEGWADRRAAKRTHASTNSAPANSRTASRTTGDGCSITALQSGCEDDASSISTLSTMATADNLPGTGRTLGLLHTFLGKRLEAVTSKHAERFGFGPVALKDRLWADWDRDNTPMPKSRKAKKSRKNLAKLMRYARSDITSNQELAFEAIIYLSVWDSYFHDTLRTLDASRQVALAMRMAEQDRFRNHLLLPSQRALMCLVDNEVNSVGHKVRMLHYKLSPIGFETKELVKKAEWRACAGILTSEFNGLIMHVYKSPQHAFLALRHLEGVLWIFSIIFKFVSRSEFVEQSGALLDNIEKLIQDLSIALLYLFDSAHPEAIEWETLAVASILWWLSDSCRKLNPPYLKEMVGRAWSHLTEPSWIREHFNYIHLAPESST